MVIASVKSRSGFQVFPQEVENIQRKASDSDSFCKGNV